VLLMVLAPMSLAPVIDSKQEGRARGGYVQGCVRTEEREKAAAS
jgi:hypothetical protein